MAISINGRLASAESLTSEIFSPDALGFLEALGDAFAPRIRRLRARRAQRRKETVRLDFLAETREVREADWSCAPPPADLLDRRVEITGPCDRKMIINALNSGAHVFMADFEDSTAPTLENVLTGQANLRDAVRRTIALTTPEKAYKLNEKTAVLFVRPRGLHLDEAHLHLGGEPLPGSLVDFGLYAFHNARELLKRGTGVYFYVPKLESHLEARLWNEVFVFTEQRLNLPLGSIRATCLIETLPAAFEMDEILFELRDHSAGLNCGRWDYIFSYIKMQAENPTKILPDRAQVTMGKDFLRAYALLLIKTCHRRNVHAMGGMAAQIPIKGDAEANEAALAKVRADKLREVQDGHDGTWVAHPGLVPVALGVFNAEMPEKNQISRKRKDVDVSREDLLRPSHGTRTESGLRHNVRVGVQYLEAWLRGTGCVPLYNLMEDAATAEICRAQIWQWIRHGAELEGARGPFVLTGDRFDAVLKEELEGLRRELGARFDERGRKFADAERLFAGLCKSPTFVEFLTLPAYQLLVDQERKEQS